MNAVNCGELLSRIRRAENERLCPECGAVMTEADRLYENGAIFVWYKCCKNECSGQWLQKMSQQFSNLRIAGSLLSAI